MAVDLVRAAVAQHDMMDAQLNAYRTFDATSAIEQAKEADGVLDRAACDRNFIPAPLCGIPVSVKLESPPPGGKCWSRPAWAAWISKQI